MAGAEFTSTRPVILYQYDFSPYAQKTRLFLQLAGIPYKKVDVPVVLPRPELEALGITYRRIPLLAVGKDVYCDTSLINRKILELQGPNGKLHEHPAAAAFERWGDWAWQTSLLLAPSKLLTPEFVKDRETIFPILGRPDFSELRPSGVGAFASILKTVEDDFLSSGFPYVGGRKEPSTADVHVSQGLAFAIKGLGVQNEPGLNAESYPKTYAWLNSLPTSNPEAIDAENGKETILRSDYSDASLQNQPNDPLQTLVNKQVNVESADTTPGAHPQYGKLVSTNIHEFAIELDNSIRVHFPRAGYYVKLK